METRPILLLLAIPSIAQLKSDKILYAQKVEKYRKMRNTGIFMTVTGVVLNVVGISLLSYSNGHGFGQNTAADSKAALGALSLIAGIPLTGGGITLWAIGNNKMKKYQQKLDGVAIQFNLSPPRTGLTLTYRF